MAKAKHKSKAQPKRARPAPPRGMYLEVDLPNSDEDALGPDTVRIESFQDIVRIGHQVARTVREYLRSIPMLPHVRPWSLYVYPRWVQTAAPKPKHDGAQRASDPDALEEG